MKKIFEVIFLLLLQQLVAAQIQLPSYADSIFPTYYRQRVTHFKTLPQTKDDIIFLGNSITDGAEWSELFSDDKIKNRGISGDITAGVINRLNDVVSGMPSKIFLLIGTNDLARNISTDSVVKNILLIADYVQQQSPPTKLYVQSILPVNDVYGKFSTHTSNGKKITEVNSLLEKSALAHHYTYINLYPSFADVGDKLKANFTNDGLHLKGEAYLLWKHIIYPYVYDLQQKPALIPLPQQANFTNDFFPLYLCKTIFIKDKNLQKEAEQLQQQSAQKNIDLQIATSANNDEPVIELRLDNVNVPHLTEEAYRLDVSKTKIIIAANTAHGIFNGIQTLMQLLRDGDIVDGCEIIDWPAFSWRGYMVDVGRNYMSMPLLKQQIDVMAKYKLNIFHFHPTEDIAWRIAVKQYPQLTAPEHMQRNKGMYYSEADIKELIAYCKERYITFVPEIDMPGHSAAFKRAMKVDMQSDSGMFFLKNILKEFCTTYDVPYIHIGADEVKITNKNFIPEVTAYIESLGKKVIGWQPGGNFTDNTIRQLWMDDNAHHTSNNQIQFIDSRHLYINHMDPLEAVTTIFNRRIADKEKGDASTLGGTICMWHDRAVGGENDILIMNPVYPSMLAFAERSWRGGGQSGWVANIDDGDKKQFVDFENRLLENKTLYFKTKLFPYVKQSNITWNLFGPYHNGGDLSKSFQIEDSLKRISKVKPAKQVTGGTIVLKHWWAPLIKGALEKPEENTTWYAVTKIWSDEDGLKDFWIGFNNISRSPATDSPLPGTWDNHQSEIWVNGKIVEPPLWKHAGMKGNSETPLIDEGYEYRQPAKILLQKGWNTILIKAPIGSFKGKDWQNPEKWMFTCVPL